MNKTIKSKKWLFPLVMAFASVLVGCTNSDYDFDEIDMTLGLGGNEVLIPTSSTKLIHLDSFLEIEEGDCVQIIDGNYVFVQEGDDAVANPTVDPVTLQQDFTDPIKFPFDELLNSSANSRARAGEYTVEINESKPVVKFENEAKNQHEILSITSADVRAEMTLSVTFSDNLKKCIEQFDVMTWELPSYMVIDETATNKLTLNNVKTNQDNAEINVTVSQFDFTRTDAKELKRNDDGSLVLDGEIKLHVKTTAIITPEMSQYLNDCYLEGQLQLGDIPVYSVYGKFNPDIDLTDLGDVEVSGTPDFLKEDGVVVDLANPQILVYVDNEMDVPAYLNATLTATKDGKDRTPIVINGIKLNQETKNQICICRDKSKVDEKYAAYDLYEVPELSNLISTIPDRIKFTAVTEADHSTDASFVLGQPYTITTSYRVEAPIAFGKDASIVYTDSIDDIYGELDGFELEKDAYLEITADVENKLPIFLSTTVTPFDVDGNELTNLTCEVEDNIPASRSDEVEQGTIKIKVKGDIQQLDKLKFSISGKASNGSDSVTGITLNTEYHTLKLDNVQVKLVGKIIYDAN